MVVGGIGWAVVGTAGVVGGWEVVVVGVGNVGVGSVAVVGKEIVDVAAGTAPADHDAVVAPAPNSAATNSHLHHSHQPPSPSLPSSKPKTLHVYHFPSSSPPPLEL